MTYSIAKKVGQLAPGQRERTPFGDLASICEGIAKAATTLTWPNPRYQKDPVGFAREIAGIEPWARQCEILEACRDYRRVTVASGHKVGKSMSVTLLALWFYCSFPDARVFFTSTTARQVNEILWRELTRVVWSAGRCVDCKKEDQKNGRPGPRPCPHSALIDGVLSKLAINGLRSGLRSISGFTADQAEAVAGISGENLLFICDEASGIPDPIYEALVGNMMGGARLVLISNPTRNSGEFYESHHDKALQFNRDGTPKLDPQTGKQVGFYRALTIPSTDTPNYKLGRRVIPGLADREEVEEQARMFGEDSAHYKIRVLGKFVKGEDGKIISAHAVLEAQARWRTLTKENGEFLQKPTHASHGRLHIGVDPAGDGGDGDESAFCARRGNVVLELFAKRGLTEAAHVDELLALIARHRVPREPPPLVCVDGDGPIGVAVYGLMRAHYLRRQNDFEPMRIRGSDFAVRDKRTYDRVRDELQASLYDWLVKREGCIPEDHKLAKELNASSWSALSNGRMKATPKSELRKLLGRSPDRADSLALSVWNKQEGAEFLAEPERHEDEAVAYAEEASHFIDPYAHLSGPYASDGFGGDEMDSPYGGRDR